MATYWLQFCPDRQFLSKIARRQQRTENKQKISTTTNETLLKAQAKENKFLVQYTVTDIMFFFPTSPSFNV